MAEMGTYGPGEIADLCRWCPPDVAVITAIGPVHLERFGTEDRIVEAKSEIAGPAPRVVLPRRRPPPGRPGRPAGGRRGKQVVRCSATDRAADVCVAGCRRRGGTDGRCRRSPHGTVVAAGGRRRRPASQPTNLACAVAVALAAGVDRPRSWRPAGRPAAGRPPAAGRAGRRRGSPSSTTPTTPTRPAPGPPSAALPAGAADGRPPGGGHPGHGRARVAGRPRRTARFGAGRRRGGRRPGGGGPDQPPGPGGRGAGAGRVRRR